MIYSNLPARFATGSVTKLRVALWIRHSVRKQAKRLHQVSHNDIDNRRVEQGAMGYSEANIGRVEKTESWVVAMFFIQNTTIVHTENTKIVHTENTTIVHTRVNKMLCNM